MLRQYNPQTFRSETIRNRPVRVGTVPVGAIVYLQDGLGPFGPQSRYWTPVCRNPWIVEAWHPREIGAARKVNGKYQSGYAVGGHLARLRSLRNGRRKTVADWLIRLSQQLTD